MHHQAVRIALVLLLVALASTLPAQAPQQTIVETAEAAGSFETLLAAVQAAGLAEVLSGPGPFTVLAPTDEAFARLPQGTLAALLLPESRSRLQDILKFHVIAGRVSGERALRSGKVQPLRAGDALTFALREGRLRVDEANVVGNDIAASNGVIHAIDAVLLPPEAPLTAAEECRALIALAVKRGAPIFNGGSPEGCAAIYEVTAASLLAIGPPAELGAARELLAKALIAAEGQQARERAWTLRRALDRTWDLLGDLEESAAAKETGSDEGAEPEAATTEFVMASWSQVREQVLAALDAATADAASLDDLTGAVSRATALLGPDSLLAARLKRALERAEITRDRSDLESAMRSVQRDLTFEPKREADLPVGFPQPTQVGEVQIKRYPAYRMAVTSMGKRSGGSSNTSFFKLFNHIKKNEIAMTAPVQMDYSEGGKATMAFLYRSTEQGESGADGTVKVIDVAPALAASIGVRGQLDQETLARTRAQLQSWLDARSDRYRATGGFRTMGWNSPFVPTEQRYSEIQIPIEVLSADG